MPSWLKGIGERLGPLSRLSRRLGLSAADLLRAAKQLMRSDNLALAAINFYVGTQESSPQGYEPALRQACDLARAIHATVGTPVDEINLGGGIPSVTLGRKGLRQVLARIRDRPPEPVTDPPGQLEVFARGLADLYAQTRDRGAGPPPPALAIEPGRSLVGNAGVLLTRVRAVQGSWAFLDASRNHLPESPLLFRRRILPVRQGAEEGARAYDLSGSSLNTVDVLDRRRRLPPLSPGDLLVLCDAGANSISRATRYAGLPPAVLLVDPDGSAKKIRHAETHGDLTSAMTSH